MQIDPRFVLFKSAALMLILLPVGVRADAASELDAAVAKLQAAGYRKRDHIDAMSALGGKSVPLITECSGQLERLVFEMDLLSIGRIRQEQIRAGSHSAVRTISPALVSRLEEAKRSLSVNVARSLLRQIASAATAIQSGGLSTAAWVKEAIQAAVTIKTTADARIALDRATAGFSSWQLVKPDDEDDGIPEFDAPGSLSNSQGFNVEKSVQANRRTATYTRRPTVMVPGAVFHSVVTVDLSTGLPTAEENFINGQRLARTEYFDVGAPISIELPECLKAATTAFR